DFYAVLDLPRGADETEIRSAFRQLSLKYHPDKRGSSSVASHENFVQLIEAYETLCDPTRRRIYDM
ncbi:heat shock protein DnaJ, partial [Hypoxylon sp. EC38]